MLSNPVDLLLSIPPILFALTLHEWSHGYVAMRLGDPTARLLGRLTLNPISHLDPLGTILLFLMGFGWAKPIPVDTRYLAHPRRDMMWIALAGPVSNVLLAIVFGTALRLLPLGEMQASGSMGSAGVYMIAKSVQMNLVLAAFNMIPIFPLDGSRVLTGLLPPMQAERYRAFESYGPMLLLGLVLIGSISGVSIIGMIVSPFVHTVGSIVTGGLL
ncbi:MAG TPA: site-2 protease family protein [Candidatus Eisenbacteria bacterium]|nr:site-2 protease family protein [Candidatus Eisenbacteria bacterium]